MSYGRTSSPQLSQWHRSRSGVKAFGWAQTVTGLQSGGAYAAMVDYRWMGPSGKTIRMARCCTVLSAVSTDRLAALRACWHPVAYADVITAPHATTLLGEPLVLWRDARGAVHAFRDVCVHRGTALSLGRVDGNEIVCAYHGWRYGADGACTAIPQLAEPTRVPARARAVVYAVCERYGVVWVALAEPAWPIPDVPELENAAWRVVLGTTRIAVQRAERAAAARTGEKMLKRLHRGTAPGPRRWR